MQGVSDPGWTQIVTWVLVFAGWWIINHQTNLREKRKEIRSIIDNLQTLLEQIETQAIEYHTSNTPTDLAFHLKRSLSQRLQQHLSILKLRGLDVSTCYSFLKQLRRAVTLSNFDSSTFERQSISSPLIKDIWLSKDRLSHELERCFAKHYR
jgi:hypothetical protein